MLDERVDKHNKTYHRTTKMKPADIQPEKYIDYGVEHNDKDPKFKIGYHVRTSKCKNTFPNWFEEVFVIKRMKILYHGHTLSAISMMKRLLKHSINRGYEDRPNRIQGGKSNLN